MGRNSINRLLSVRLFDCPDGKVKRSPEVGWIGLVEGVGKGRYCEEPYTFGKSGVSLIFELPFLLLLTIYE